MGEQNKNNKIEIRGENIFIDKYKDQVSPKILVQMGVTIQNLTNHAKEQGRQEEREKRKNQLDSEIYNMLREADSKLSLIVYRGNVKNWGLGGMVEKQEVQHFIGKIRVLYKGKSKTFTPISPGQSDE